MGVDLRVLSNYEFGKTSLGRGRKAECFLKMRINLSSLHEKFSIADFGK